jgi:Flp pilus assembly protein protease CpaA
MDRTSGRDEAAAPALPPSLRVLKWLVILLTLSMIGGVITIVALLVTRMPAALTPRLPVLPETIALPAGATPEAVTFGPGWVAVVAAEADGARILVYGTDGRLRGEARIAP